MADLLGLLPLVGIVVLAVVLIWRGRKTDRHDVKSGGDQIDPGGGAD